jgi:hypothetical protein
MKKEATNSGASGSAPGEKTEFSLIPPATLTSLYANLLKGRMLEARIRRGKGARDEGWEAVKAATAAVLMDLRSLELRGQDLHNQDLVTSAEEIPVARLLRGTKATEVLREREARGEAGSLLLHAVGVALASRTKKDGKVVVVFWRDAAQQLWQDVLEMARAHTLPMILVSPASNPAKDTRGLAPGTELPRIAVDGYDAVAVYRVVHEAIDRARRNRGATLIECAGFRVEGQRGRHGDAVLNMERYLRGKGMLRRGMRREIEEQFAGELRPQLKPSWRRG